MKVCQNISYLFIIVIRVAENSSLHWHVQKWHQNFPGPTHCSDNFKTHPYHNSLLPHHKCQHCTEIDNTILLDSCFLLDVLVLRNQLPLLISNLSMKFNFRSIVEDTFEQDFVVIYHEEHTAVTFSSFGRFLRNFFSGTDDCFWVAPLMSICVSSLPS